MIEVKGLTYHYSPQTIIRFPDFALRSTEQCLLLGESGSGKTTLLHLLGGLLKSQQGSILVNDTDITRLSASALDHFRGRNIGFIFQRNHLVSSLTVKKNLLLAPYFAGLHQDENRIDEILAHLNLGNKKDSKVTALSQGQAQRVAIARAVLHKPTIIFADEPTSALDDRNCFGVIDLLLNVAKESGSTLVVATHDQRLKAKVARQILLNEYNLK
jgi:ABC-type lipoprotein export system ATPase subunit